jgi:hypothetical protein
LGYRSPDDCTQTFGLFDDRIVDKARLISWFKGIDDWILVDALVLLGALYGGVHCLPWNNEFPTLVERQLWRIAAVILTSAGTCSQVVVMIGYILVHHKNDLPSWVYEVMKNGLIVAFVLAPLSYCIANLYVLVESFRQLLYLPPQA